MRGDAHRVAHRDERHRIELDHEDVVVRVEVVMVVVRARDREQSTVVGQHGEVDVAAVGGKPRVVLGQHRPRAAGREIDGVDRSARARGPDAGGTVRREPALATAERGRELNRSSGSVELREGRGRRRRPAPGRIDQESLTAFGPVGDPTLSAGREVVVAGVAAGVDVDQLVFAPPHRGVVTAVMARGGNEHAIAPARGGDEV